MPAPDNAQGNVITTDADALELESEAQVALDGALNEKGKSKYEESEEEEEEEDLEADISEHEETNEAVDEAEAEAEEKGGKKVTISCTVTEEDEK